jgi:hypothetical protein
VSWLPPEPGPQPPQHFPPPPPPPPPYGGWPGTVLPGPGYPPASRTGLHGWGIALIVGGVGVLVLLVLAAVAIPVFLHQRAQAELSATSVSLPPAVAGMTEVDDPATQLQLADAVRSIDSCGCTEPLLMTLYQDNIGTHRVLVATGKFSSAASASDQRSFSVNMWAGIRDGAEEEAATVGPAVETDAGRLGGTMTCAPITADATGRVCVSVDRTSFVMMMEFGPAIDPTLPVIVRESVVHRT